MMLGNSSRSNFDPAAVLTHLMRKGVGLPQSQLLIVEGVSEYAAHHRNVLQEEEQKEEEEASHAKFKESPAKEVKHRCTIFCKAQSAQEADTFATDTFCN